jgi:hypothetical protein
MNQIKINIETVNRRDDVFKKMSIKQLSEELPQVMLHFLN